ncbi:MAG: pro-sigmaK processing inhibitor BofA family protein [Clostridia bacterium]|nr:pro-sigmaK processing inhibitor BofA family protein [Clostridia bacterium]
MNAFFIAASVVCSVCVAWWVVKSEKGATSFFLSAVQGIAALFAVNLTGMITGVTIAANWYTVISYIVLGLPGVIGTLALDFMMK